VGRSVANAVLALAILKPWGGGPPASPSEASVTLAPPTGAPVPAPTPAAPDWAVTDSNAMTCLTHQSEQVLTLERWPDREIKSWFQATAAGAEIPEGLAPAVIISSSRVVGIGVCPGTGPVDANPASPQASAGLELWAGAVVTSVRLLGPSGWAELGTPRRITVQTDYIAAGVLYGPPETFVAAPAATAPAATDGEGTAPALATWRPGRYAIGYYFPRDPGHAGRWVVVEIRAPLHED
jgi:hypothetical protein